MPYTLLPAPISYVRHLVDTEDDPRAKIDQIRVLAQNTFQLLAAILVNDCLRIRLVDRLSTPPRAKSLSIGDFVTFINEASQVLYPSIELCFVPELVRLYGESGKVTRTRKARNQLIVEKRNADVHTASLGQTQTLLNQLSEAVEALLAELSFLENYLLVAARNLELSPDKFSAQLHGKRCHGPAMTYPTVSLDIKELAAKGEVILAKVNRSDWLSLRPWLLYSYDLRYANQGIEELLVLNEVEEQRLKFIGLVSGETYRLDADEWLKGSVFAIETSVTAPRTTEDAPGLPVVKSPAQVGGKPSKTERPAVPIEDAVKLLDGLTESSPNVLLKSGDKQTPGETWVLVRSPLRDIPVAFVDTEWSLWLHVGSLQRAARDGLIAQRDLDQSFEELKEPNVDSVQASMVSIGKLTEHVSWLRNLARKFKGA